MTGCSDVASTRRKLVGGRNGWSSAEGGVELPSMDIVDEVSAPWVVRVLATVAEVDTEIPLGETAGPVPDGGSRS